MMRHDRAPSRGGAAVARFPCARGLGYYSDAGTAAGKPEHG